jgi:hypothetical protein
LNVDGFEDRFQDCRRFILYSKEESSRTFSFTTRNSGAFAKSISRLLANRFG